MGTGASQPGRTWGRWHHDRTDRGKRSGGGGFSGSASGDAAQPNLPAGGGTARLHPESEWETEAVRNSDGEGPGSTDGDHADSGADFRSGFPELFVRVPAGTISTSGAERDTWSPSGRVSGGV